MLSVCCLSGDPNRLAELLPLLRPVADEVVVAVDDRADLGLLAATASLVDRLFVVPYADPPERSFQWLHEQTSGDWVFRIDDDEAPSAALLELLWTPPADVTHAFVPRRWLHNGHAQTIASYFIRRKDRLPPAERRFFRVAEAWSRLRCTAHSEAATRSWSRC